MLRREGYGLLNLLEERRPLTEGRGCNCWNCLFFWCCIQQPQANSFSLPDPALVHSPCVLSAVFYEIYRLKGSTEEIFPPHFID